MFCLRAEKSAILVFQTTNRCRLHCCRSMSANRSLSTRFNSAFRFPILLQMAWKSIWKPPVQLTTTEVCSTTAASTISPSRPVTISDAGMEGCFLGSDEYPELNQKLHVLAEKYNVSDTTIAAAWILRHPANMQIITGTTSESRLKEIIAACEITLTREEWYELYLAAGHPLP